MFVVQKQNYNELYLFIVMPILRIFVEPLDFLFCFIITVSNPIYREKDNCTVIINWKYKFKSFSHEMI